MRRLAEICIQRPIFASMLIMALVVVGATAFFRLGVDRFPAVDLPTVSIRTTLAGASPEEVENEVTQRIEEVVNTVDGIDELRSISGRGTSVVVATFRLERNIETATQDVRDRVATVLKNLPDDADPPIISKMDNDSRPVITVALSGQRSMRELTEIADKLVKVQLERAQGVGGVNIVGGLSRVVDIQVDADKLSAYRLPITVVRDAVALQNSEIPGGRLTGSDTEQQLRTLGRFESPDQFNDLVIARVNGAPIRLRDVAQASDGSTEQRSAARLNGTPAVTLEIQRQSGANTIAVIDAVKKQLDRLLPQLPAGVKVEVIEDQSRYINAALHEINVHLIMGSILACLVVLLFMRSLRSVFIAGIAIPASVISTFGMMWALGFTLNSVTMLALVLMVGIVIDDAIVVLENIFRFVEEKKMSAREAALKGTTEIALAVLATTLSLVVIFVPVSFMSSISGRFLYQFGVTAAVAVMISLLVSFTLTPMLGARLLKRGKITHEGHRSASRAGFYAIIDGGYTWMLRGVMRYRIALAIVAILVMASAIPLYRMVKQDYLPADVDEGEFTINVTAREGTSFAAMDRVMQLIQSDVAQMPEIVTTLATSGGGFMDATNSGRIYVRMVPHEQRLFSIGRLVSCTLAGKPGNAFKNNYSQGELMIRLRRMMRKYPNLRVAVRNMPGFSIGAGGNTDIALVIRGPELERLAEYSEKLRSMCAKGEIPGIADSDTSLKIEASEARIHIDRETAADLGVSSRDIGSALGLMVGGDSQVSRYRDPQTNELYNVQIRLRESDRREASSLPTLLLPRSSGSGGLVELRNLATVDSEQIASRIDRLNRQRAATLSASVAPGYALADRLDALRAGVDSLKMPPEYSVSISGRGRELEKTFTEFLWAFSLSVVFMYMILASNYESLVHPLTILLSLPLSVPFALLSLYLSDGSLNLYSALGILVLFGVVKKNAILQIDHMNHLRHEGMPRYEAIIQGNRDRLRPILMTTLALVAGMLPLALGSGPGAQERRAVAIVVIGGQTLSLLLTLLVTPVAYSLVDDLGRWLRPNRKPDEAEPAAPDLCPSPLTESSSPGTVSSENSGEA